MSKGYVRNIKEIIREHLQNQAFDGLYLPLPTDIQGEEPHCWCALEDLMNCDTPCYDCRPGKKHERWARDGDTDIQISFFIGEDRSKE